MGLLLFRRCAHPLRQESDDGADNEAGHHDLRITIYESIVVLESAVRRMRVSRKLCAGDQLQATPRLCSHHAEVTRVEGENGFNPLPVGQVKQCYVGKLRAQFAIFL